MLCGVFFIRHLLRAYRTFDIWHSTPCEVLLQGEMQMPRCSNNWDKWAYRTGTQECNDHTRRWVDHTRRWVCNITTRLLPETQNCGLRMRRECRERFPRHWLQRKPPVSNPDMHHGTCVIYVAWCMSGSLTHSGRENAPDIPGECATRNFVYLVSGPWWNPVRTPSENVIFISS